MPTPRGEVAAGDEDEKDEKDEEDEGGFSIKQNKTVQLAAPSAVQLKARIVPAAKRTPRQPYTLQCQ